MLRVSADTPRLPLQGLMGWDSVARDMGAGISSVLTGSSELLKERERVEQTGELAAFSDRLRAISDEARAELEDRDVRDWDYSWNEACSPRLAEAVAELPPASREAGRELAEAFSARASVQALRDREVAKIGRARSQWRERVEAAADAGDEEAAQGWLQSGESVFVAPGEMEAEQKKVSSRACAARWRRSLDGEPLQGLADLAEAPTEALPEVKGDRQALLADAKQTWQAARRVFADRLESCVLEDREVDADELARARRARLLPPADGISREDRGVARCRWRRRMDECGEDEESQVALKMQLALSDVPAEERKILLRRFARVRELPLAGRSRLSRSLWHLYQRGAMGRPGDRLALSRLAELQDEGIRLLGEQGEEASSRWLDERRGSMGRWVCFLPDNQ